MKEASNKKTQRVKVTQINPGGQQEEEHGVVHHVQVEHYPRKVLGVWVIVSGPVGHKLVILIP